MGAKRRFLPRRSLRLFDADGLDRDRIRTLNLIVLAAVGGTVWGNVTGGFAYVSYWKSVLGVSDSFYGVIIALPPVFNALQIFASYLLERWLPRKSTFIVTGLLQRSVWILFGLAPAVIPMEQNALRVWVAATLAMISAGTMPLFNSAMYSMFTDVVPPRIRGRYFSVRSMICISASLLVGLTLNGLPDVMPGTSGYTVLFAVAGALGVADICLFLFMRFPEMRRPRERARLSAMFKGVLADRNYMWLVAFGAVFNFSGFLCGGFTGPYMRQMGLSNMQGYLFAQVIPGAFGILTVTFWGRGYDRYGTRPLILINATLCCLYPLIWSFVGPGGIPMMLAAFVLSGLVSSAFEVGAQNLFMGQSPDENRTMYIAVYFIGTQLFGSALAGSLGGWLLDNAFSRVEALGLRLGGFELTRYNYQFMVSFLLRLCSLRLLFRLREEGSMTVGQVLLALFGRAKSLAPRLFRKKEGEVAR